MNFGPWTGWIIFDEFDLMVLGAIAGGFACRSWRMSRPVRAPSSDPRGSALLRVAATCWGVLWAVSLARGLLAAPSSSWSWFSGEADPLNAWRVAKAPIYAMLLWPLLRDRLRASPQRTLERFCQGMQLGMCVVAFAALWERAVSRGLFDFGSDYRTVALFWEMHVGGAAIDAYFAISVPFVAHAVISARSRARWAAAAGLAILVEYAVLTTFSRGAYLAAACGLLVFAIVRRKYGGASRTTSSRRSTADRLLLAVLLAEGIAIAFGSAFLHERLQRASEDFGSRIAHWRSGIGLLHDPASWWLGLGMGRLPAAYGHDGSRQELSGGAREFPDKGGFHVVLTGPPSRRDLAGRWALTQQVTPPAGAVLHVQFDARSELPARVGVAVCQVHLLYAQHCRRAVVHVAGRLANSPRMDVVLVGPPLPTGWLPRMTVFTIAVLDAGASVTVNSVSLHAAGGPNLLANGDFSARLAHWFPLATAYFVPWHVDNLGLELLIEQGVMGLVSFAWLVALAFRRLLSPRIRGLSHTPVLVASLTGALTVGLVSSVLDVPRVAFLLFLMVWISIEQNRMQVPVAQDA